MFQYGLIWPLSGPTVLFKGTPGTKSLPLHAAPRIPAHCCNKASLRRAPYEFRVDRRPLPQTPTRTPKEQALRASTRNSNDKNQKKTNDANDNSSNSNNKKERNNKRKTNGQQLHYHAINHNDNNDDDKTNTYNHNRANNNHHDNKHDY